jgi:hypothetical protein
MAKLHVLDPSVDAAMLSGIMESTYPIWNEGLSREGYDRWNTVQLRTPWGANHLRRVALMDGDTVLASAKRYTFE